MVKARHRPSESPKVLLLGLGILCLSLYHLGSPATTSQGGATTFFAPPPTMPELPEDEDVLRSETLRRKEVVSALRLENKKLQEVQDTIASNVASGQYESVALPTSFDTRGRVSRAGVALAVGSTIFLRSSATGELLGLEKGVVVLDSKGSIPDALRSFVVVGSSSGDDWVGLKTVHSSSLLEMVAKTQPLAWVVRAAPSASSTSLNERQQWRIEQAEDGLVRLFNRGMAAYLNIIVNSGSGRSAVRGHGGVKKHAASTAEEPTTLFSPEILSENGYAPASQPAVGLSSRLPEALRSRPTTRNEDQGAAGPTSKGASSWGIPPTDLPDEKSYIEAIRKFPSSGEKRVIAYALFGSDPKYLTGANRNAELVGTYYPGWSTRFYCDNSVPSKAIDELRMRGAEVFVDEHDSTQNPVVKLNRPTLVSCQFMPKLGLVYCEGEALYSLYGGCGFYCRSVRVVY